MQARQVAFGVLLLAIGGALLVGTGYGLGTLGSETVAESNESDEQFGLEITSFAQSSAVETERAVEGGMWNAGINVSELPEDAVRDRTRLLEDRLAQLEERHTALAADRENMSEIAYTAQASQVRAEIANVRSAVNQTRQTAARHGVDDVTALERLHRDARNMTGPDIAAAARNITDTPRGPPGHAGPPADAGPPAPPGDSNESDRPGNGPPAPPTGDNETNGPGGGQAGPPTDGNESDRPGNGQADPPTDDSTPGDSHSSDDSRSTDSETDRSDGQSDRGEGDVDEPGQSDDTGPPEGDGGPPEDDAGPPDDPGPGS